MKLLTPATRAEWLALRTGYVSSTESSALFGHNPYMTAFELGVMKRNKTVDESSLGERPKWGTRLQDAIAHGVSDDYGVAIIPMEFQYAVDDEDGMGASFDYKIVTRELEPHQDLDGMQLIDMFDRLGPGLLEIKNVDGLEYRNKWINDEAPDHIEIQLQHQLEVLGLAWGAIAALVGGNRVGLIVRERDRKVGGIIRRKVRRFWDDFKVGRLPDPLMPDDAAVIVALYQYAEPNKVYDGSDPAKDPGEVLQLIEHLKQYKGFSANITELEKLKKVEHAKILEIIKDAERAIVPGFSITATMVAPTRVEAFDKAGYRYFGVYPKKPKEAK